jgi:DTW domain
MVRTLHDCQVIATNSMTAGSLIRCKSTAGVQWRSGQDLVTFAQASHTLSCAGKSVAGQLGAACRAKPSNSGCVAHLTLQGSELLMNGLPAHDVRFAELCADPDRTVAALWPSEDALSASELQAGAERNTGGRITLVAVDATWNGARHLANSYDKSMLKVKLAPEDLFVNGQRQTLMAPLRKYKPDPEFNNRCALPPLHCLPCAA